MKKVSETYICDLCKKEDIGMHSINYPMIFLTDQTEGRPTEPYIYQQKIDVCNECLEKIIKIRAYGAMGNNTYMIQK